MLQKFKFFHSAITPVSWWNILKSIFFSKNGLLNFEKRLLSLFDKKYAYSSQSFMRAIFIALNDVKNNTNKEEVILPRYACPTFTHSIMQSGLKEKYVDVDPSTLGFDYEKLNKTDLTNVAALIVVNHFGLVNNMEKIKNICVENNIFLIEDLGYSVFTEYKKSRIGTFGDYAVFNFKEGKSIPIQGGMTLSNKIIKSDLLVNRKKSKANILRVLAFKIISYPIFYKIFVTTMKTFKIDFRKSFTSEDTYKGLSNESSFRFNNNEPLYLLSDFQGKLGCYILDKIDKHIFIRNNNAKEIIKGLKNIHNVKTINIENDVNKIHYIRYPVLIGDNKRNYIMKKLLENNFEARDIYSEISVDKYKFPGAYLVSKEILTLPCHPLLSKSDIKQMVSIIIKEIN